MARQGSVMERSGLRMKALRVIAVGIFTGIEKETHDIGVAELSGKREGAMPAFRVGCREEFLYLGQAAQAGGGGYVRDPRTASHQGLGGVGETERQSGH